MERRQTTMHVVFSASQGIYGASNTLPRTPLDCLEYLYLLRDAIRGVLWDILTVHGLQEASCGEQIQYAACATGRKAGCHLRAQHHGSAAQTGALSPSLVGLNVLALLCGSHAVN